MESGVLVCFFFFLGEGDFFGLGNIKHAKTCCTFRLQQDCPSKQTKVSRFETCGDPVAHAFRLYSPHFPQRRAVKFSHAPLFLLCHQLANSQRATSARLSPPQFLQRNSKFGYLNALFFPLPAYLLFLVPDHAFCFLFVFACFLLFVLGFFLVPTQGLLTRLARVCAILKRAPKQQ